MLREYYFYKQDSQLMFIPNIPPQSQEVFANLLQPKSHPANEIDMQIRLNFS